MQMKLTKGQADVMQANGHLLITGGPGSGKTTISILKAAQIAEQNLKFGQKVLFLSFARATVSRVMEAIKYEQKISQILKNLIAVDTYHAFFGRILKTHGYLIGLPRRLKVLAPPEEAVALSKIRAAFPARGLTNTEKVVKENLENTERSRLAKEEGQVCFDFYAPYAYDILSGSARIRSLIASMYPAIILDEFQDTSGVQWKVVRALGEYCRLIALADPEQRIYDWLDADPARLEHFREAFRPLDIDLSTDNHRSAGTEIAIFGDSIRAGEFKQNTYNGILIDVFQPSYDPAMSKLVTTIYVARKRLIENHIKDWTLAILVPTKKMTRQVSDALYQPPANLTAITHSAVIEMEAVILGAEIIAYLMQPPVGEQHFARFIDLMCNYFQGKGGDNPTKTSLQEAENIRRSYDEWLVLRAKGRPSRRNSILNNILEVYMQVSSLIFIGDPDKDWLIVRKTLEDGACKRLNEIAYEVRNLRLLRRGTQLRQALSQNWQDTGAYHDALSITRQSFVQMHFDMSEKPESGVIVMNMHKAKGKQFDEVIIFEGWPVKHKGQIVGNPDRIVKSNSAQYADQARLNFRVSITRSKRQTTILTPQNDPCVLLPIIARK